MSPSRTKFLAGILLSSFFSVLLYCIIYKAIFLPITHDEKSATVYYAFMDVWNILMSDIWPSNHILNSLLIKLCENIFGIEPWSVRLPNILSFILFSLVLYFMAKRFFTKSWLLFCLPFFVVFCNPYLLDFFGLARGYGLSNAFMTSSVFALLLFAGTYKSRWYYVSILFAMLAAYANFTLLIYWVAVHMILIGAFLYHSIKIKQSFKSILLHISITALIAVAFAALCYVPLYKMQSTNQFVYWSKEGFYQDTLLSAIYNFLYSVNYPYITAERLGSWCLKFLGITCVYVLIKILRNRSSALSDPLVILTLLLLTVWLVNITQTIVLGTPFLTNRTALSYYVLFALVFLFAVREIAVYWKWLAIGSSGIIIILAVIHLRLSVDLAHVREWRYDADTYHVIDYLDNYRKSHPSVNTVQLNSDWLYNPSLGFYCITGKTPWIQLTEYHKEVDTASQTLFYYARHDDMGQLKNYTVALDFPENLGVLLIRK